MWSEFSRPTLDEWRAVARKEVDREVPLSTHGPDLGNLGGSHTKWRQVVASADEAREAAAGGAAYLTTTESFPELPCVTDHDYRDPLPAGDAPVWISTASLTNRGATAVQELAHGLAAWISILEQDSRPERFSWVLGVGTQLFEEVAKLRAARILWAKLMKGWGWNQPARLHVVQSRLTYTLSDRPTNLLRSAAAVWVACLAGAETVQLEPVGPERWTRNQLHVMLSEGFLQRVQDPLAGSYSVDSRTDALAREAWSRMQSGDLGDVEASYQEQLKSLATDRACLVGTTRYVTSEELPAASDQRLATPFEALRRRGTGLKVKVVGGKADFVRKYLAIAGIEACDDAPITVPADSLESDRLEVLNRILEAAGR